MSGSKATGKLTISPTHNFDICRLTAKVVSGAARFLSLIPLLHSQEKLITTAWKYKKKGVT
jgi:hypothetical protein